MLRLAMLRTTAAHRALTAFALLVSGFACSAGQPEADPSTAQSAGTQTAGTSSARTPSAETRSGPAENPRIAARNVVQLRQNLGRSVTVFGPIGHTAKSKSGHRFLNFSGSELTAVCFPDDVENFQRGDPATTYDRKDVEVRGKLELYRGKLQIRVRGPEQVRIVDAPGTPDPPRVTLQKVGTDTWVSPAGLRYQGRDPAGLTRVEHVARHARDIPDRDGPHGVFDGDEAAAFAVIDEAWNRAHQRKLRPKREGDRSSFTVRMNRRVGYLGGRSGASRGHPPLNRVFIVVETGTKNVITAFPK